MLSFDKIVNKMWKQCGKIMFKNDIFDIIDPENKPGYQNQLDKTIYKLKANGVILSLKAGVYIIPDQDDKKLNKIDLIDTYYMRFLKKVITTEVGNQYYISGKKSLEIHLKNYEIPEKLFIMTRSTNKKVKIGDYEIIFKTISGKDSWWKKINLFSKFFEYCDVKTIEQREFKLSCLELSLLEAALVTDSEEGLDIQIINKALKKYKSVINYQILQDIGKYKYIMSFNRLKELSRQISPELSLECLDIIKSNGWLFIWEWLRGI